MYLDHISKRYSSCFGPEPILIFDGNVFSVRVNGHDLFPADQYTGSANEKEKQSQKKSCHAIRAGPKTTKAINQDEADKGAANGEGELFAGITLRFPQIHYFPHLEELSILPAPLRRKPCFQELSYKNYVNASILCLQW